MIVYVYKCETAEENSNLNITPLKCFAPVVYNMEKRNQPTKSEIVLTSKTPVKQQNKKKQLWNLMGYRDTCIKIFILHSNITG